MPITQPAGEKTREMCLVSQLLTALTGVALDTFIAKRRLPGEDWASWESIAYEIRDKIGESYTREALRRWARRYGIPIDTTAEDGPELVEAYRAKLNAESIKI